MAGLVRGFSPQSDPFYSAPKQKETTAVVIEFIHAVRLRFGEWLVDTLLSTEADALCPVSLTLRLGVLGVTVESGHTRGNG